MRQLAADFAAIIEANEPTRKNRRSAKEQAGFMAAVEALVCNMVLAAAGASCTGADKSDGGVLICLGVKAGPVDRYSCRRYGPKTFRAVLDAAEANGFLTLELGGKYVGVRRDASRICPTVAFSTEARRACVSTAAAAMIGRASGEELVRLSRPAEGQDGARRREQLDYRDTPETRRWRKELAAFNAFLTEADISYASAPVPASGRRLVRHFSLPKGHPPPSSGVGVPTGVPRLGGRLYGAFWSTLAKEDRRASLRIGGEPIAELDANAMFVRLAYARHGWNFQRGLQPPEADPYALIAKRLALAGFPGVSRPAVKKAVNAMFFGLRGFRWPEDIEREMPNGLTVAKMRTAVMDALPEIAGDFAAADASAGFEMMFTESEIILEAVKALASRGVVGLPLHDALLCARSKAEEVREAFAEAAVSVAGVKLEIGLK